MTIKLYPTIKYYNIDLNLLS